MDATSMREASKLVLKVGVPVTLIFGTFGNTMILLIERRLGARAGSSLSIYFICMALLDFLASWLVKFLFLLDAFEISFDIDALCKVRVFAAYSVAHVTAGLHVAMTCQRAAAILWPLKVNSVNIARAASCAIFLFFSLFNSHILFGHTLPSSAPNNLTATCFLSFASEDYGNFFTNIYGWLDTCFSSVLPFGLLFSANCVLVWKVSASLKAAKRDLTAGFSSQTSSRQKQSSTLTVTVIAVSLAFFVLTLPVSVYGIYAKRLSLQEDTNAVGSLTFAVTAVLYFWNNTANFYLLCLTGSKYRSEFAKIFWSGKSIDVRDSNISRPSNDTSLASKWPH